MGWSEWKTHYYAADGGRWLPGENLRIIGNAATRTITRTKIQPYNLLTLVLTSCLGDEMFHNVAGEIDCDSTFYLSRLNRKLRNVRQ